MTTILPKYISKKFIGLFLLCLLSVIILFLVIDSIENMDKFIDKKVPVTITLTYYLYFIPYILVLTLPVATLLATVFSIIGMAKGNEIVACKSLGYSLYQTLLPLLALGLVVSALSFFISELVVSETGPKKTRIEEQYLHTKNSLNLSRFNDMHFRDNNKIITIGRFDIRKKLALRIKIEEIQDGKLVYRLDADSMQYENGTWVISRGFERKFNGPEEVASPVINPTEFQFHFSPDELIEAQGVPEQMPYRVLKKFIARIQRSGGETSQWLTELHIRFAFPFSNLLIVFFSVPLAYNRRNKNIAVGFGISLTVVFLYFGIVKMGQTMGQNGNLPPFIAAWLGNAIMVAGGIINLIKTRK